MEVTNLGSSMSLFNCARFGKSLSVLDFQHFGSSMSVRGIVRLGSGLSLASNLRLGGESADPKLQFKTATTFIKEATSGAIEVYVDDGSGTAVKSATFESDGGVLHGSWDVETSLVTSDRRLKTNIMPLQRTLRDVIVPRGEKKAPSSSAGSAAGTTAGGKRAEGDGALWLLRQLRPVSYSFR